MRPRLVPIVTTALCVLAPLALGADSDPKERATGDVAQRAAREPEAQDLARENARLRQQVESLQARVGRLEARVKALEAEKAPAPAPELRLVPPAPQPPRATPRGTVPRKPGGSGRLPEGWQERRFNGIKFYIVPLKPAQQAATPRTTESHAEDVATGQSNAPMQVAPPVRVAPRVTDPPSGQ